MISIAALLAARFRSMDQSSFQDAGEPVNDLDIPAGCNMGRRRSRAVLYQLSGHYKPEKIKTKLKLNNVSNMPLTSSKLVDSCYRRSFKFHI